MSLAEEFQPHNHELMEIFDDSEFLHDIDRRKYGYHFTDGKGKSGKTLFHVQLMEICPHIRDCPKAMVGFTSTDHMPSYLHARPVAKLTDVVKGEKAFLEDASMELASRERNTDIQKLNPILSHKNILAFISYQSSANVDLSVNRDQEVTMAFKLTDNWGIQFERPENKVYCVIANRKIKTKARELGVNPVSLTYIAGYDELLYIPYFPWWYDDRHSRNHADTVISSKGGKA